jgi:ABC-type Fe3+/spermidine/putrescine transport system ATPase subunit
LRAAVPILLRGLRKAYGPVRALDDVDLDVVAGEFLTLLGPSGSGKTTLLMVLAGFIRPDQGSLKFGDEEVIRLRRTNATSAWCSRTMRCSPTWTWRRTLPTRSNCAA